MSSPSPSRRAIALVASSGLLLGGLAVAVGASAAAPCPTYTDVAGDSAYVAPVGTPDGDALFNPDDDTDVLDVSHSVDAGVFTSTVHVTALGDSGPYFNFADRFQTAFTVATKAVTLTVDRDYTESAVDGSDPVIEGVLAVGGTATTAKVTVTTDYKANAVTAAVAVADLEKAVGAPLAGLPFSAMSAAASVVVTPSALPVSGSRPVDTATAPATASYVFGGSCSGGAPTVTPTGTPTPTPTPTSSAEGPVVFDQPRKDCVAFKDPAGDADPSPVGAFSEDALDITQVNLKTAADGLQVFVKLADLGAALTPVYSGAVYGASVTVGGKVVAVSAGADGPATATVAGKDSTDVKATAKLDAKASNVVFTLPKAGLEKVTGTVLKAGTAVTATTASTAADTDLGPFDADSATGTTPQEKTYAYGDNTCFMPPPGALSFSGATAGVYSDTAKLVVSLVDEDQAVVPGATIALTLSGQKALKARTNAEGDAVFALPVTVAAGARTLTASFIGNADVGAVSLARSFAVKAETAVLRAGGAKGAVTATLTDNDRTALRNQVVAFTVGSRVTKVRTDSRGRATLTGLARGTTAKVSFAAVKGYYSAAPTASAKAL